MLSRNCLALTSMLLLFSLSLVHAKGTLPEVEMSIRTYGEMMQMTPAHRRMYLIELRKILVEFERNSEKGLPVANNESLIRQLLEQFTIPSANADGNCQPYERVSGVGCEYAGKTRPGETPPGYTCINVMTNPPPDAQGNYKTVAFGKWVCTRSSLNAAPPNPYPNGISNVIAPSPATPSDTRGPAKGCQSFEVYDSTLGCLYNKPVKKNETATGYQCANYEGSWVCRREQEQLAPKDPYPDRASQSAAVPQVGKCLPRENTSEDGSVCTTKATPEAKTDKAYACDDVTCTRKNGGPLPLSAAEKKADNLGLPTDKKDERAEKCKIAANKDLPECKDAEPGTPQWEVGCTSQKLTCKKDRDLHRGKFYKSEGGKPACLYAGNISKYPTPKPQKGKCDKVYNSKAPDLKCEGGKVICNPFVFGWDKDKKAICVSPGVEATEACDATSPKDGAAPLFDKANFPGLSDEWNKFVEAVKKVCSTNADSAYFHCSECNILSERLFNLERKVASAQSLCAKGKGAASPAAAIPAETPPAATTTK